jgi:hypothetical protein
LKLIANKPEKIFENIINLEENRKKGKRHIISCIKHFEDVKKNNKEKDIKILESLEKENEVDYEELKKLKSIKNISNKIDFNCINI